MSTAIMSHSHSEVSSQLSISGKRHSQEKGHKESGVERVCAQQSQTEDGEGTG